MTLVLDERRLAMLEQFGIRLPPEAVCRAGLDPAPSVLAEEDTGLRVEPAMTKTSTIELAPRASGVELMEWDALAETVAACRACKLCSTRRCLRRAGDGMPRAPSLYCDLPEGGRCPRRFSA